MNKDDLLKDLDDIIEQLQESLKELQECEENNIKLAEKLKEYKFNEPE